MIQLFNSLEFILIVLNISVEAKTEEVAPGTDIPYLPQLKFEHKLVQFRFFVQAADAATVGADMKITNMFINNAISKLELIVADKREILWRIRMEI